MWTWQSQASRGMAKNSRAEAAANGRAAAAPDAASPLKLRRVRIGIVSLPRDDELQRGRCERRGDHDRGDGRETDDIGTGKLLEPTHHRRAHEAADRANAVDESEPAGRGDTG